MVEDLSNSPDKLSQACNEAFARYPASCSHAVWYVIKHYKTEQKWMNANELVDHVDRSPDWKEVDIREVSELASSGILVIGGAKEEIHGHVIVVFPGKSKQSGGYKYMKGDKERTAVSHGEFALAMSTSKGTWPGAKSNGDKTVFDAWGEAKFKSVRFWKYVGPKTDAITLATPKRRIKKKSLGIKLRTSFKLKAKATEKMKWRINSFTRCVHAMSRKWQRILSIR